MLCAFDFFCKKEGKGEESKSHFLCKMSSIYSWGGGGGGMEVWILEGGGGGGHTGGHCSWYGISVGSKGGGGGGGGGDLPTLKCLSPIDIIECL